MLSRNERRASRIAGLALLSMAALAGYANLGLIAHAAELHPVQLELAALLMAVVALLDVIVGLAVWGVFRGQLAAWSSGLRVAYAAVLLAAVFRLATGEGGNEGRAAAFHRIFDPALGLFGVHLMLLAVVLARTPLAGLGFRRVLAALVLVAGAGYSIDAVAPLFGRATHLGAVTFVGELVLMGWLLWLGFSRSPSRSPLAARG